jgi:hypothetical protein
VSLAYVVPVEGDCAGRGRLRSSARRARADLVRPEEIREPAILAELANGQSALLLQALAHLGV